MTGFKTFEIKRKYKLEENPGKTTEEVFELDENSNSWVWKAKGSYYSCFGNLYLREILRILEELNSGSERKE